MGQVHSVLVRAGGKPCAVAERLAAPWLRPYVVGYCAFRTGPQAAGWRVLPLTLVVVVVEFTGAGALVSGPRDRALVLDDAGWWDGIAFGLTPAGVRAVLGLPMGELTGVVIPLGALAGSRADELTGRLAAAPGWAARFTVLDDLLTAWLRPDRLADPAACAGWHRLQDTGGRIMIGDLAARLSVGRRRLETGFGREIGLTPKTVARIARFQEALEVLAAPSATLGAAAARGYADQPHFNREVKAMAGVTPSELRAFVQYKDDLLD